MTDRNQQIRALLTLLAAFLILFILSIVAYAESGVCYDMSIDGTLAAHNPHVERIPGIYHLWALHKAGVLTDSIYWAEARKQAKAGKMLWLNIEADQSSVVAWRRPHNTLAELNPDRTPPPTLADVKETHRLIQVRLEAVLAYGAPVWDYRTVQVNSLELWVSQPDRAYAELERLVRLVSYKQGSLAKRLNASGGGVIFEVYVPDAWNTTSFWHQVKAIIALERQMAAYDKLGIRAMPLLNPGTVDGAPVRPDLLNALLQAAKSKGDYGFWAMPGAVSPELAKEVGAWIK